MHRDVSRYDRILISLAMAVLGAVVVTGTAAKAQDAGLPMLDRYGGEAPAPLRPAPERISYSRPSAHDAGLRGPIAAPEPFSGRSLTWSGKSFVGPEAAAPAPAAPVAQAPARAASPLPFAAPTAYARPEPSVRARQSRAERRSRRQRSDVAALPVVAATPQAAPVQAAAPPPRPAPHSIHDPAPVAAATPVSAPPAAQAHAPAIPVAAAVAPRAPAAYGAGSVRRYSVHREFGMQPDPTPIPPQFFTASADLSDADAAEATPMPRTPPAQAVTSKTGRGRVAAAQADPS